MIAAHATKFRFTLWTAAALLAVLGILWALPQSALARAGSAPPASPLPPSTTIR